MSDWPNTLLTPGVNVISAASMNSIGGIIGTGSQWTNTATVWPTANLALFIPFTVEITSTAYQMAWENVTPSGNIDVGIYDVNFNQLVHSGSTTMTGSTLQAATITSTTLTPGNYFMAMAMDNTTGIVRIAATSPQTLQLCGVVKQATAFPLPAVGTPVKATSAFNPMLTIALTTTL